MRFGGKETKRPKSPWQCLMETKLLQKNISLLLWKFANIQQCSFKIEYFHENVKYLTKINPAFLVFNQDFPFNVYLFSEVWHLCNFSKRWQIYIWDPDISFKISIIVQYLKIYQLRIFEWDESITKGVEFSKVSNI